MCIELLVELGVSNSTYRAVHAMNRPCYFLYVNGNAKKVVLVVKQLVCSTQGQNKAVRSTQYYIKVKNKKRVTPIVFRCNLCKA